MPTCLYLDTARLGRMCPEAQAADRDFARLAGEEGCSLYFEHFLRWGFPSLPPSLARQYPGLSSWRGVTALKRDLKTVLALPHERQVLVANRSAQLVRLAARLLCLRCQNILVSDMEWPAYMGVLAAECRRMGRQITTVPIRQSVLRDGVTKESLVSRLAAWYRRQDCDGFFLSAVTYQGVRLPIRELVDELDRAGRPRFAVVDGAQAFNHVPLGLASEYCDLLLAGCHKWLRAYHPLGLAICCRPSSEGSVGTGCHEMLSRAELDDPLLSFTMQLEDDRLESFSETVNLAPMFTATAAVRAMLRSDRSKAAEFAGQLENADLLAEQANASPWRPLRPSQPTRTGILLLEAQPSKTKQAPPDRLRLAFQSAGVALTVYDGGLIRVSLPDRPMSLRETKHFHDVLCRCA